jgi:hydrogenase maturation protease
MTGATLVVGLGRRDRGDDGIGPEVARAVAGRLPRGSLVRVLEQEDPTALLDLWEGHDHVVVVDAVVTGQPAGTVHRFDLGTHAPPLPPEVHADRGGTHAFGLATAVELGRALGRLPARVVVVGVEAGRVGVGTTLSPCVARGVVAATALVLEEVATDVPGRAR